MRPAASYTFLTLLRWQTNTSLFPLTLPRVPSDLQGNSRVTEARVNQAILPANLVPSYKTLATKSPRRALSRDTSASYDVTTGTRFCSLLFLSLISPSILLHCRYLLRVKNQSTVISIISRGLFTDISCATTVQLS